MFIDSTGNFDEAIKLFTEAIFKNPSASMYAKRARYLTDIFLSYSVVVVVYVVISGPYFLDFIAHTVLQMPSL